MWRTYTWHMIDDTQQTPWPAAPSTIVAPWGVVLARIVAEADAIGAAPLGRALACAISTSEREAAFAAIRRAFTARSVDKAEMDLRLSLLDDAMRALEIRELEADEDVLVVPVDAVPPSPTAPVVDDGRQDVWSCVDPRIHSGKKPPEAVDVVPSDPHGGDMAKPPKCTRPSAKKKRDAEKREHEAWIEQVHGLAADGHDARLIELAASARFAGNQKALAEISGLTEESICRTKAGRSFSPGTRAWFVSYLTEPSRPPPMERGLGGQKPRPGTLAPQIWCDAAMRDLFVQKASAPAHGAVGQIQLLSWCLKRYLAAHPKLGPVPEDAPPEGIVAIRVRIDPAILTELDHRIGGSVFRAAHIRAALKEGLKMVRGHGLPAIHAA